MSRPTEAPVHLSNFRLDKVSIGTPTADLGYSANDPLGQTGKTPLSLKLETSTLDLTFQAVDLSPPIPQPVRIRNSHPISRALSRRNRSRLLSTTDTPLFALFVMAAPLLPPRWCPPPETLQRSPSTALMAGPPPSITHC